MKLRCYLDTSVISAYFDHRHPERQVQTQEFWNLLDRMEVSVSEITHSELAQHPQAEHRDHALALIAGFTCLLLTPEITALSQEYVRRGVFSETSLADARHVAVAVSTRQDLLVSWNFRHLVNRRRRALVNSLNVILGYPTIEIVAPPEVALP